MDPLRREVGQLLRARREQLGWKLIVVAVQMGVRKSAVCRWEHGDRGLDLGTFYRLAAVLRCDPRDLLPEPSADVVKVLPGRERDSLCLGARRAVES